MTQLTERYLAAALRGIPEAQRTDVERELRSSIADALEDRASAGEDRATAEKAVLEGLGDPVRLAADISGRPLYLIGPDLFVEYRQLLVMLLIIVMPIVGIVQVGLAIIGGDAIIDALMAGAGAAVTAGVHTFFWITLAFALVERLDAAREAKERITDAAGRWTVDRLPALPPSRVTASETVGEVITSLFSIGGILVLNSIVWSTDATGAAIPLFNPGLWTFWLPALIAVLVALTGLQVVVFLRGRWTMRAAVVNAVLQLAFSVPVLALMLTGSLINPAFADAVGWPPLAGGNGPVMLPVAASVALVTAWEIFDGFRRARRVHPKAAAAADPQPALK